MAAACARYYCALTMLMNLTLSCRQLAAAIPFYDAVLGVLGAYRVQTSVHAVAFAANAEATPFLWLVPNRVRPGGSGSRFALMASDGAQIRPFHDTAIAEGAVSLTRPSAMPQYGLNAFGCLIQDPDGHQIEVVAGAGPAAPRPLNESADDACNREGFEHYNA